MFHRHKLILLPPNRVWRSYPGGRTLDELAGVAAPADSHLAEDWIASTTRAVNPSDLPVAARADAASGGVSQVCIGFSPTRYDFAQLLASDPVYFLGHAHVKNHGAQPQLLVKFLDSGTRLHFQVHPTREFARRVLQAPSGKTEAYHVLAVREPGAFIYAGFQRPPSCTRLRELILTQDIAAIEACFDRIPVQPGDTFIIPGGTPHALGAGVFMVEIQEPSDLVVRFEFERAGYRLLEAACFMNRDLECALDVFDLTPLTPADVERRVRCRPRRIQVLGSQSQRDELIGARQTDCFRVTRAHLRETVVMNENRATIAIVTAGSLTAEAGGETHLLRTCDKVFLPAGLGPVTFTPQPQAEILECLPPG